ANGPTGPTVARRVVARQAQACGYPARTARPARPPASSTSVCRSFNSDAALLPRDPVLWCVFPHRRLATCVHAPPVPRPPSPSAPHFPYGREKPRQPPALALGASAPLLVP